MVPYGQKMAVVSVEPFQAEEKDIQTQGPCISPSLWEYLGKWGEESKQGIVETSQYSSFFSLILRAES